MPNCGYEVSRTKLAQFPVLLARVCFEFCVEVSLSLRLGKLLKGIEQYNLVVCLAGEVKRMSNNISLV